MQKVVGSSPIIRSLQSPARRGFSLPPDSFTGPMEILDNL
jgi:hypothetical protein